MAVTYKVIYNRFNKLRSDGTAPVHLRVIYNRKIKYLHTGILIKPNEWSDKNGGTIIRNRKAPELNKQLSTFINTVRDYEIKCRDQQKTFIPDRAFNRPENGSLILFIENEVLKDPSLSAGTIKNHNATIAHLKASNIIINLGDLTLDNIEAFDRYLIETAKLTVNTRLNKHKHLKSYVNRAINKRMMKMDDNPYLRFKLPKPRATKRRFLNIEQINAIIEKEMPNQRLEAIKDLFLFSCFTGLAYSDVDSLSPKDFYKHHGTTFIITNRTKTDEESAIPLLLP